MKPISFTAILLIALAVSVTAQTKQTKSTLEIFEKSISVELDKLCYLPGVDRTAKFIFYIESFGGIRNEGLVQEYSFMNSQIRKAFEKNNLSFSFTESTEKFEADSSYNKFKFKNVELKTAYPRFIKRKFLGERTIERKISAGFIAEIVTGQKSPDTETIKIEKTDEIDYDKYEQYETDEYGFTKAEPPPENQFEAVIFPILLVTVSAAATVLFFIIRTK